jgi:hypothetical protein
LVKWNKTAFSTARERPENPHTNGGNCGDFVHAVFASESSSSLPFSFEREEVMTTAAAIVTPAKGTRPLEPATRPLAAPARGGRGACPAHPVNSWSAGFNKRLTPALPLSQTLHSIDIRRHTSEAGMLGHQAIFVSMSAFRNKAAVDVRALA